MVIIAAHIALIVVPTQIMDLGPFKNVDYLLAIDRILIRQSESATAIIVS
jgi:hypothetical protein